MENLKWRVIPRRAFDASMNMAIDEAIAESVGNGSSPPTIRFYGWSGNGSVTLGVTQATNDINMKECAERGIQVVRRVTGGMAMYHSPADITYSIAVPRGTYKDQIEFAQTIVEKLILAIEDLGIRNVKSNLRYSILADGKKIAGNAQRHGTEKNYMFQHGSIFVGLDYPLLASVLAVPEKTFRDKTTSVDQQVQVSEGLYDHFERAFLRGLDFAVGEITETEKARALELSEAKYSTDDWTSKGKKNRGVCTVTWGSYPELERRLTSGILKERHIYDDDESEKTTETTGDSAASQPGRS